MELKDLKNAEISLEERAAQVLDDIKVNGKDRSVAKGLQKGDVFTLVNFKPVEMAEKREGFQPMVFFASNGASVGTKHFAGIEFEEEGAPILGATVEDNAKFYVYCVEHEIEFRCRNIKEGDERVIPGDAKGRTYIPKEYVIELA